jgi:hypothetical protein
MWGYFDVNGNGYLSLAEIDKGMRDVVCLPKLFDTKPVLMRAYMASRDMMPAKTKYSDSYVTKGEFRFLLRYLRVYFELWIAFSRIDKDGDRRVSYSEFVQAIPMLEKWGIDMSNPK